MYKAHVDSPWAVDANGSNVPKLAIDPAFSGLLLGWVDITGSEGVEVEVTQRMVNMAGDEVDVTAMKTLYGGNYAAVTGIRPGWNLDPSEPDYDPDRLGGSGDPDFLLIEIKFDEVANPTLLADIDADSQYNVYSSEPI